jgi:hypothetical protein
MEAGLLIDFTDCGVSAMMITGVVMILFILGLFFSMLGPQPKADVEWQNDTDRESAAPPAPVEAAASATQV